MATPGSSETSERLAKVTYLPGVTPPADVLIAQPATETVAEMAIDPMPEAPVSTGALPPREAAPRGSKRDFERISNVSMYALARRGMSTEEMVQMLRGREFDEDDIRVEIDRLEGVGLLDDATLAETLVRTLSERKGLGRSALVAELRRRRIDPSAIESALEHLGAEDQSARATEIAIKRAPQLRGLDHDTAKRRLGAFLMRKGYSGSAVSAAVAAALEKPRTGPQFR